MLIRDLAVMMITQFAVTIGGKPAVAQVVPPYNTVVFTAVARHRVSQDGTASADTTITFCNHADHAITFLFGKGMPPTVCQMDADNTALVIQANVTCPLEHVHDCFHAETITLEPGQQYEGEVAISVPEGLFSHAEGHPVNATYVTQHDRTTDEPIIIPGTMAFYSNPA